MQILRLEKLEHDGVLAPVDAEDTTHIREHLSWSLGPGRW